MQSEQRLDPEAYRRANYETWEAMAPGWERWRAYVEEVNAPVPDWLVRELAPQPGDPGPFAGRWPTRSSTPTAALPSLASTAGHDRT